MKNKFNWIGYSLPEQTRLNISKKIDQDLSTTHLEDLKCHGEPNEITIEPIPPFFIGFSGEIKCHCGRKFAIVDGKVDGTTISYTSIAAS